MNGLTLTLLGLLAFAVVLNVMPGWTTGAVAEERTAGSSHLSADAPCPDDTAFSCLPSVPPLDDPPEMPYD